jgi:hypothetical protein
MTLVRANGKEAKCWLKMADKCVKSNESESNVSPSRVSGIWRRVFWFRRNLLPPSLNSRKLWYQFTDSAASAFLLVFHEVYLYPRTVGSYHQKTKIILLLHACCKPRMVIRAKCTSYTTMAVRECETFFHCICAVQSLLLSNAQAECGAVMIRRTFTLKMESVRFAWYRHDNLLSHAQLMWLLACALCNRYHWHGISVGVSSNSRDAQISWCLASICSVFMVLCVLQWYA